MTDNDNDSMSTQDRVKALNNLRGDFSKEELIKTLMINQYKTDSLIDAMNAIAINANPEEYGLPYDYASRLRMREAVLKWLLEVI